MDRAASTAENGREASARRLGAALGEMLRRFEQMRDRTAKELGLHPTDFACIGILVRRGATSPRDILSELRLTSGSGTALVDRLEAMGYVRRIPNPEDRRSLLLELDEVAAAGAIARYREVQMAYRGALDGFSDQEVEIIARCFEALAAVAA